MPNTEITTKRAVTKKTGSARAGSRKTVNGLIEQHQQYVKKLVFSMIKSMHLPLGHQDEYLSAGYLGLVEAARKFDPRRGKNFESYAHLRIRGAVIDNIRAQSNLCRRAYRYAKAMEAAETLQEEQWVAEPGPALSRCALQTVQPLSELLNFAASAAMAFRLSLPEAEEALADRDGYHDSPEELLIARQDAATFRRIVKKLPPKERLVMENYYFRGLSFKEITARHRDFSKSWISKLHSRALEKVKTLYLEETNHA